MVANLLKMAKILPIEALRAQGWSARRIARELGIHRDTVRRYTMRKRYPVLDHEHQFQIIRKIPRPVLR